MPGGRGKKEEDDADDDEEGERGNEDFDAVYNFFLVDRVLSFLSFPFPFLFCRYLRRQNSGPLCWDENLLKASTY